MVADERSWKKTRPHVPQLVSLRTLGRGFPVNCFSKTIKLHVEWPPSSPVPRCLAVGPDRHGVVDVAGMLKQPARQRVLRRNLLTKTCFQAQRQGSKETSYDLDANLGAAVGP